MPLQQTYLREEWWIDSSPPSYALMPRLLFGETSSFAAMLTFQRLGRRGTTLRADDSITLSIQPDIAFIAAHGRYNWRWHGGAAESAYWVCIFRRKVHAIPRLGARFALIYWRGFARASALSFANTCLMLSSLLRWRSFTRD